MKRITIVAGARPNFVKVAPLIRAIQKTDGASYQLIYAGREDDPTLEDSIFDDLQMPRPDIYLGVDSTSLNEITSRVMAAFDALLDEKPADVVIVVDDLASTMAAAIVTKKRGLKLAHLVAGTRSFDMNMPKEVNRLVIDALSDYLFTAGVKSNSVATREQAEGSSTYMVGNILMDTLRFNHQRLKAPAPLCPPNWGEAAAPEASPSWGRLEGAYLVFTLNRKALLADEAKLQQLLEAMLQAADGTPIIAPLRGQSYDVVSRLINLNSQTSNLNSKLSNLNSQFSILKSLNYLEFGWLTAHAKGIITDSGNVAEEATFNGVPCITLNSYTEHQETISVGSNVLVGEDPQRLAEEVSHMVKGEWKKCALPDRWDGRTAERIVQILMQ